MMTTIPIEVQVSTEQLIQAVEQLPPQEFSSFLEHILAMRAQRDASYLSSDETALMLQINQTLPLELLQRLDELIARRQAEAITPDELAELIEITHEVENLDATRLIALNALARLRGTTLPLIMAELGIKSPYNA